MPSLVGRVSRGPGLPVFVAWASLSFMVLSTVAFWPAYLSRPARTVDLYTHAHAALGAAWLIVLFAQSRLAQARRHAAHVIVVLHQRHPPPQSRRRHRRCRPGPLPLVHLTVA